MPEEAGLLFGCGHIAARICHHEGITLLDRKSTRLNSSHPSISYAVFCVKKKKEVRSGREEARRVPRGQDQVVRPSEPNCQGAIAAPFAFWRSREAANLSVSSDPKRWPAGSGGMRRPLTPLPSRPNPTFFFSDAAPAEIYTLSLHDALPI